MLSYGPCGRLDGNPVVTMAPGRTRLWTASLAAYEVLEMPTSASPARARGSDPVADGPAGMVVTGSGPRFRPSP